MGRPPIGTRQETELGKPFASGEDALMHELSEALTALGHYLGAAQQLAGHRWDSVSGRLGECLEGGLRQQQRAVVAVRALQTLARGVAIGDGGLVG